MSRSCLSALLLVVLIAAIAFQVSANDVKCLGTAPTPDFNCVNGVWTKTGDLNITEAHSALNLNTQGTPVLIQGTLRVTRIVFVGQPTHLNVTGCIEFPEHDLGFVGFKPSKTDAPSVPAAKNISVITTLGSDCLHNITDASVYVISPMGCKNVSVESVPSINPFNLVVRFNVDSTSCRRLGIIVGSLIGGLVLLTLVIVGISYLCCKKEEKEYERINYD